MEPMRRLDAQAIAEVVLDDVRVPQDALLGGEAHAVATLRQVWDAWVLLSAADLLGVAEACLETTTRYASERVQFGRPIGTFQAVSHRLADSAVDVEIGRSLVYAAGLALDEGRENASALASAAKAWLSDAAVVAGESALQLHGGVGFTWEYDVHLLLRRAHSGAATLGDADFHRDRVASHMERVGVHSARESRS
jgi:alkylation response protein AidB-like acyl-CoA dehydrogenase